MCVSKEINYAKIAKTLEINLEKGMVRNPELIKKKIEAYKILASEASYAEKE